MRRLVFILLGLLALPIYASVRVDVFNAEVVLDQESGEDAEKLAKAEGMRQVIIKASGDKQAAANPVVKKALNKGGQYLSQLGFGEQSGQQTLKMRFNPPQIQSLLNQASLPYWSDVRSSLVVWVVEEGRYGREILWEQSGHASLNQIAHFSDLRGLPITIPVGDIDDVTGISAPELWGGFIEPVSSASMRYSSDAVLIIRVQKLSGSNNIRWTLYDEKPEFMIDSRREPITGNASGNTHSALEEVIDEVSNYYARKSSVKSNGKSESALKAQFIEVKTASSFFALEKMLKDLSSVASVDVEKIVGNEITFDVHLLGSELDFETEVVQNRHIRKFEMPEPELILPEPQLEPVSGTDVVPTVGDVPPASTDGVGDTDTALDSSAQEVVPSGAEGVDPAEQSNNGLESTAVEGGEALPETTEPVEEQTPPLVFEWIK